MGNGGASWQLRPNKALPVSLEVCKPRDPRSTARTPQGETSPEATESIRKRLRPPPGTSTPTHRWCQDPKPQLRALTDSPLLQLQDALRRGQGAGHPLHGSLRSFISPLRNGRSTGLQLVTHCNLLTPRQGTFLERQLLGAVASQYSETHSGEEKQSGSLVNLPQSP